MKKILVYFFLAALIVNFSLIRGPRVHAAVFTGTAMACAAYSAVTSSGGLAIGTAIYSLVISVATFVGIPAVYNYFVQEKEKNQSAGEICSYPSSDRERCEGVELCDSEWRVKMVSGECEPWYN